MNDKKEWNLEKEVKYSEILYSAKARFYKPKSPTCSLNYDGIKAHSVNKAGEINANEEDVTLWIPASAEIFHLAKKALALFRITDNSTDNFTDDLWFTLKIIWYVSSIIFLILSYCTENFTIMLITALLFIIICSYQIKLIKHSYDRKNR